MIYFTCEIDCENLYLPGHKEGFGSAFQMLLGAYAISKHCRAKFVFVPMKNIGHSEYFDYNQEEWDNRFAEYCENFLLPDTEKNIKFDRAIRISDFTLSDCEEVYNKHNSSDENILIYLDWKPIKSICDTNIHIIDNIKQSLIDYYSSKTTSLDKKTLSIHVRIFSKTDCDPSPWRNYYVKNIPNRIVDVASELCKNNSIEEV
jgi:hypothetical protein